MRVDGVEEENSRSCVMGPLGVRKERSSRARALDGSRMGMKDNREERVQWEKTYENGSQGCASKIRCPSLVDWLSDD